MRRKGRRESERERSERMRPIRKKKRERTGDIRQRREGWKLFRKRRRKKVSEGVSNYQ